MKPNHSSLNTSMTVLELPLEQLTSNERALRGLGFDCEHGSIYDLIAAHKFLATVASDNDFSTRDTIYFKQARALVNQKIYEKTGISGTHILEFLAQYRSSPCARCEIGPTFEAYVQGRMKCSDIADKFCTAYKK